ncbi:C40 family peptidase [Reyranella sp.]|uniref:C40 family peptidase n=1 Tax=Reyranella sp. TaxID=1929291 RepID=UPI004036E049
MALEAGHLIPSRSRLLSRATAWSVAMLATAALIGTTGVVSPAMAQAKVPAKSKLKPAVKAVKAAPTDPTDRMADELNARWQQQNSNFAGFNSAAPAAAVTPAAFSAGPAAAPAAASPATSEWGDRLVSRAMNYLGTPYRYGGTSPKTGFDCSGFVYYLYGAVFGQRIPRMPHDMVREATPVARSDLQKGDLVMFGYRGAITHVGIYSGNGQFVHATHRGSPVMVTSLDADYYNTRYLKAVRLTPQ